MGRKTFWLLIISFFHILLFLALTYLSLVFFIIIILFNWRIIKILWWLLPCIDMNQPRVYMCPHPEPPLPPPSPSHPSGLSQYTGFEYPVSCIELGLIIYFTYGNIHVSMLFSQNIPPSPSPTESKSLCFLYLCLFCCLV